MTSQTNSLPLACPSPADTGFAAVVAHAAQSSSGVGTSLQLIPHPADQKSINHCAKCNRFWVGFPFIAEIDKVMDGLLPSLGVALSHDVAQLLSDEERQRRINNFFGSDSFQTLSKVGNRLFEICAQNNISVVNALIDYFGEQGV